ncbi:DUF6119 family protein [Amycolatopsis nivea]
MTRSPSVARRTTIMKLTSGNKLESHLAEKYRDKLSETPARVNLAGYDALLVSGTIGRADGAEWCPIVNKMTGKSINLTSQIASAALLVNVDEETYALTYGMGRVYIDPLRIEANFGIRFAVRALNPEKIREVTRNVLNERARIDRNSVPGGQDIDQYFIEEYGEIVSRLVGECTDENFTFIKKGSSKFTLRATDSLNIPVAKDPEELVSDLRSITKILKTESPVPSLEFVDQLREVKTKDPSYARLEEKLSEAFSPGSSTPLSLAYPRDADQDTIEAQSYRIKMRGSNRDPIDELELNSIIRPLERLSASERIPALKAGYIQAFGDESGTDPVSGDISCAKWIACDVSLDSRQYFFHAGSWFEVGQQYTRYLNKRVEKILSIPTNLELPVWPKSIRTEGEYSTSVADNDNSFTRLDTRRVSSTLHKKGIEPCDLVGPNGELIHIKPADRSAPLSHLFNQGSVSAELFHFDAEARSAFIEKVKKHGGGRDLGQDWRPTQVIFALASEDDRTSPDSLFTFAKVALARCYERICDTLQIKVSVIHIQREPS